MNRTGRNGPSVEPGARPAPRPPGFFQVVRPLVVSLGLIVLVFLLYEIARQTWLIGADRHLRGLLRAMRGTFSIVVLSVGIAWMMLKAAPRLPVESSAGDDWLTRARLTAPERIRQYAWWFICMRWIAVVLTAVLVSASVWVFRWLPRDVWWPLLLAVATLAGVNLVYMMLLHRDGGLSFLLPVQGFVDVGILTFLLHFSGGLENPLAMIVVFHVIIGGILLSRRQCYALAATASGLFALLGLGEWSGILEHHTLLLSPSFEQGGRLVHLAHYPVYVIGSASLLAVVLLLTANFVTTLAERMRNDERRLEVLADRALAGQQLLEQALDTTGTGLRVVDESLQTRWANRLWRGWFEAPPGSEARGPGPPTGRADLPANQSLQDGRSRVTELAIDPPPPGGPERQRPGVPARTFKVTTAPLKDATGRIQQIAQLAEDITGHKELQARMVRAERLAALGQLAGQVAHEVNNPIGIISGKIWVLLSDHRSEMTDVIAGELGKIREAAERVARIASGLLSYSRPSRGERARLDLRLCIRKSLALIEEPARRSAVQIRDLLPRELPPIHANAGEMEQVFLNLFLNALDAMPNGGCLSVSAQVLAEPRDQVSRVAIVVADTGVGIAPDIRERLFEPFFTTKQEGRGTGLGLGICLGLVRGHRGEIDVESEPNQGTRFTVTLPVEPAATLEETPADA